MRKDTLTNEITDYIEKSGEGADLSKAFREGLVKLVCNVVYAAVKAAKEEVPMKETVPESDASIITKFKHPLKKEVYYILFKQVKKQEVNSLRVKFGWQYAVLQGKTEEIQIRADYGVLYKINGDWVLQDHTFSTEKMAIKCCQNLNEGTSDFGIVNDDVV